MRRRVWHRLAHNGADPNDRGTWSADKATGLQAIRMADPPPADSPVIRGILDDVFGDGAWAALRHCGQALVTFPTKDWTVPTRLASRLPLLVPARCDAGREPVPVAELSTHAGAVMAIAVAMLDEISGGRMNPKLRRHICWLLHQYLLTLQRGGSLRHRARSVIVAGTKARWWTKKTDPACDPEPYTATRTPPAIWRPM